MLTSCPAPRVVSALATSLTTVVVTFDRRIDPTSIVPNGSQFTITGGISAVGANPDARTVTLTTGSQTGAASYQVTVAATVKDLLGSGVDVAANQASFTGFAQRATVLLNEMNPNIAGGLDLMELRATGPGDATGITIQEGVAAANVLATLPALTVATGDLIVVHLSPAAGVSNESASKSDCSDAACYAGAWDVRGGSSGATFSNRVIVVKAADGTVLDAVPFVKTSLTSPPSAFPPDLQTVQAMTQWLPADCAGAPCSYTSTPTAQSVSVDWTSVGNSAGGTSVQRHLALDNNMASDWQTGASTFGAANP
jgi:hypothetical protein